MSAIVLTWVIVGWALLALVYLVMVDVCELRRPIADVADVLQPIDLEEAEYFLDRDVNRMLWTRFDRKVNRRCQRNRMLLYLKAVRRMNHNARVLVNFAHQESKRIQKSGAEGAAGQVIVLEQLQREAIRVRAYAVLTILKLYLLLAIHPIGSSSLAGLRTVLDFDGIQSYKLLRNISQMLFEEFGSPVDKLVLKY